MGQAVSSFAEGLGEDGIPLRTPLKPVTATSPRSALRMSTQKQNHGTGSKLLQEASEKLETQRKEQEIDKKLPGLEVVEAETLFSQSSSARGIISGLKRNDYLSIEYVNSNFEKLLGYSSTESLGKSLSVLDGPLTDTAWLERAYRSLQALDERVSSLNVIYTNEGCAIRVLLTVTQLLCEGQVGVVYSLKIEARPNLDESDNRRKESPLTVTPIAPKIDDSLTEQQLDDVLPYLAVDAAVGLFAKSTHARGVVDALHPFNVRYLNPAWELLYEFKSVEMRGKSLKVLQGALTDKNALDEMIRSLKNWDERAVVETFNYSKSGRPMKVRITSTQLQHVGRPGSFYSFKLEEIEFGAGGLHFNDEANAAPLHVVIPHPPISPSPQSLDAYLDLQEHASCDSPGSSSPRPVDKQQQQQQQRQVCSMTEYELDKILPHFSAEKVKEMFNKSLAARGIVEAKFPFSIVMVNGAWESLCGYSAQEAQGKSLDIIQGPLTSKIALDKMIRALQSGSPSAVAETINYHKNGKPMHVTITSTQLLCEGRQGSLFSFKLEKSPKCRCGGQGTLESDVDCFHESVSEKKDQDESQQVLVRAHAAHNSPKKQVSFFPRVAVVLIPTRDEVEAAIQLYQNAEALRQSS